LKLRQIWRRMRQGQHGVLISTLRSRSFAAEIQVNHAHRWR
jgi:hypothetical protein